MIYCRTDLSKRFDDFQSLQLEQCALYCTCKVLSLSSARNFRNESSDVENCIKLRFVKKFISCWTFLTGHF